MDFNHIEFTLGVLFGGLLVLLGFVVGDKIIYRNR